MRMWAIRLCLSISWAVNSTSISEENAGILSKGALTSSEIFVGVNKGLVMLGFKIENYAVVYSIDSEHFEILKYLISKSGTEEDDLNKPKMKATVFHTLYVI